jgi:uncharacterized protein (TIGR02391 family)
LKTHSHGIASIIRHWINEYYKTTLTKDEIITLHELIQELKTQGIIVRDPDQSDDFVLLTANGKKIFESGSLDTISIPSLTFDQMNFHPKISEVSKPLYESGNYNQAILEAFKAVNNFVKNKTGRLDLDGKSLMSISFNAKDPLLKLNDLISPTDIDEQEGFMHLFMGAMQGIRNPLAHAYPIQPDSIRTLEYLSFASLLIRKAEESKKV